MQKAMEWISDHKRIICFVSLLISIALSVYWYEDITEKITSKKFYRKYSKYLINQKKFDKFFCINDIFACCS